MSFNGPDNPGKNSSLARRVSVVLSIVLWMTLAAQAWAVSGLARHKRMYAVPTPGKIAIDGKLDDWDLSGQIRMFVVSETAEMQSAKFALMYDEEALYVSGQVRDPSPMMNRHDPKVDPEKAWDADVCQIYLCTDPSLGYPIRYTSSKPEHKQGVEGLIDMYLWYYTDRKEPCLAVNQGMGWSGKDTYPPRGAVPADKFQAVYVRGEDGMSYQFEYRIPWSTMLVKRPLKAPDVTAFTVQFDWSDPHGLKSGGRSAWAYDVMSGPGFPFQSTECWGKLIFSDRGNLSRELVEEGAPPEPPMPLTFEYDLPEESEVTIQLFDSKNKVARILVASAQRRAGRNIERWNGLDDAGKPLAAGSYTWAGLYHQPIQTKFVLSVHNSGQPPYKLDNNTGGWGADHGVPTTVCAAGDRMVLAWSISESGWGLILTDLEGKKLGGVRHNAIDLAVDGDRLFVAGDAMYEGANSVKIMMLPDFRPVNWGNGKLALEPPDGGEAGANVARGVSYAAGRVFVSWTERDVVGVYDARSGDLTQSWTVPAPGRLAARPDGKVLVLSEGKVLIAGRGQLEPLITDRLDDPAGIALGDDGRVYVANRGSLQNVSVFTADGKYQKSIGKPGGRPRVGRYEKSGILEPGGIAVDQAGRLWIAETLDGPKRHSVWDVESGDCPQEFFGGSSYFGWAWMDPKHPDEIYCHNVLWKVDLDRGTWRPHSTIWRDTAENMIRAGNPSGYAGHFRVMTARNGKQFGWGMIDYSNMLFMREGDIFKPIAGTIRVASGPKRPGILYPVMTEFHEKHKAPAYLWQDANDDQTVQVEELTVSPSDRGEKTFNWIDEDFNAWCDEGFVFRPVRFESDGRPVYDFGRKEDIPFRGGNSNATSLWLDPEDGGVYTLNPGADPGFAKWTRDGKLIWGFGGIVPWPKALSLPVVTPGKLWGLTMPLTVAGEFTGAATYFNPYHIFTRDGLYVAMIMRDGRTGGLGPDITASETITGQLVKPEGMDRYFLLAGDQDGRVTEILGLDTVKRLKGGDYVFHEAEAKKAAEALAEYERLQSKSQRLVIVRGRSALELSASVAKTVDDQRGFSARAAHDAENLYVAFDVTSPHELVNTTSDLNLLFHGGNCLDIQIATDPEADPKRKKPAPGDVRVLVTRQAGKPVAVVYRPKVKVFQGEPIVLTSPTGSESFDVIESTDKIGLVYQPKAGGFKATATIPLSLVGWTPKPGTIVRMDLGYLFGNQSGSQAAVRTYWTNNSFSANVTYDVPNESRLEPHEWGHAAVE